MAKAKAKTKTVVIENKRASLIELPGVVNDEGVPLEAGIKLLPGENTVDAKEWDRVKSHCVVKMYCSSEVGYLKVLEKEVGKSLSEGLDALSKKDAIAQIEKCESPEIISDWKASTENEFYAAHCATRIKELEVAQSRASQE